MASEPSLTLPCPKCAEREATLTQMHEHSFDVACALCGEQWTLCKEDVAETTLKALQIVVLLRASDSIHTT
jgi:hypothetical protein